LNLRLALTAGSGTPLTGDLYIDKATPALVLKHSGTVKGYVQATATEFDIYPNGVPMALGDAGQAIDVYCTSLDMNSKKITGLLTGTADTDAVNVGQMNTAISGVVTNPLTTELLFQANAYAGSAAGIVNSATGKMTINTVGGLRIVVT
jgi:hypothetical protein